MLALHCDRCCWIETSGVPGSVPCAWFGANSHFQSGQSDKQWAEETEETKQLHSIPDTIAGSEQDFSVSENLFEKSPIRRQVEVNPRIFE